MWSSIPIRDCQRARQSRSVCRPKRRAQVARPTARSQGNAAQRHSGLSECGRRYDGEPKTCLALQLVVLTFVRTTELRAAQWSEIEGLSGGEPLWRIPAERMKMKREHLVPLAPQAVAVLRKLRELPGSGGSPFLFPSPSRERCMSNNTMLFALYRMGYHGRATVHGFRAMASTALNEMGFRPDVIERQLAHEEKNTVRAAYNRAEYLTERRAMMNRWADHIDAVGGRNIISLQPATSKE